MLQLNWQIYLFNLYIPVPDAEILPGGELGGLGSDEREEIQLNESHFK